jgi:hypothetical protein
MTPRTEASQPAPVEIATQEVLRDLSRAITEAHARNRLDQKTGSGFAYTELEFRRMLALYLYDKPIADWADVLGIPDPSDPHEGGHRT